MSIATYIILREFPREHVSGKQGKCITLAIFALRKCSKIAGRGIIPIYASQVFKGKLLFLSGRKTLIKMALIAPQIIYRNFFNNRRGRRPAEHGPRPAADGPAITGDQTGPGSNFFNKVGQHDHTLWKLLCKRSLWSLPVVELFLIVSPCQLNFCFAVPQGSNFFV